MDRSVRLGTILGIPIRLHITWFIVFALILVSLSWQYFPYFYPGWTWQVYWAVGLASSLLFFASVLAHELCHSLVSTWNGIPVHSITLFVFGGVSRISRESTQPTRELLMAGAGPLSSLALAGIFLLIWWLSSGVSEQLYAMAGYLGLVNLLLAGFNMIPGFPLDGGRMLRAMLWRLSGNYFRSTRAATIVGRIVAYAMVAAGAVVVFWMGEWFMGLWLVFIGFFLENAASNSLGQLRFRELLQGITARDAMVTDCPVVPRSLTLRELVRDYVFPSGRRCFMVAQDGRFEGLMSIHNIKSFPEREWETIRVSQAMTPVHNLGVVQPSDEVYGVLERMGAEELEEMPVVQEGRVVGLVLRENLERLVRTRTDLGI